MVEHNLPIVFGLRDLLLEVVIEGKRELREDVYF
jgi:hypothetical protein